MGLTSTNYAVGFCQQSAIQPEEDPKTIGLTVLILRQVGVHHFARVPPEVSRELPDKEGCKKCSFLKSAEMEKDLWQFGVFSFHEHSFTFHPDASRLFFPLVKINNFSVISDYELLLRTEQRSFL